MLENSNNFYFAPCESSSELLIIFSGAGARNFNCFKLLKDYPINRLFIRDDSRSWYQNPVPGHWRNIDDMISQIKVISDCFECSRITCMGGSMGGYAAMITAAKLHVGRALLFSPQTILDHRLPNQPSANINIRYSNAFDLLLQSPETKVKFLVGTEDLADIYNVSQALQYRRFDVEFIYRAPHNLMNFLFQRNMLLDLISDYLNNSPSRFIHPVLNFNHHPNLLRICCEVVRGFYFDEWDYNSINSKLDQLQEASPDWPALYHHRGKLNAKHGNHVDAVEQFEKAISLNTCDDAIFYDLGNSAIQAKEYEKAEHAFRKANELSLNSSPTYLSKLGAAVMLQRRYDEAIEVQNQVLKLNGDFGPAYYQMGLVFNITKRYADAVPMFETAIAVGYKNQNLDKHLATARTHSADLLS